MLKVRPGRYSEIHILRKSAPSIHMVTHKPKLYVYKSQSILNPNTNTMLPDRPEHGLSDTGDIAQQYSFACIVSQRILSPIQKIGVGLKNVITVIRWY